MFTLDEKITILGHDNIDVDAFVSGILLSNLLSYLEIKNEFIILEDVREDDTYLIVKELFDIDMKEYQSKGEDFTRSLFLVDHYKTVHEGDVQACIDHHPTSEKVDYPFYCCRIACSTSYMVYELMQEVGYEISAEEAKMIVASMMVDTVSFRSTKTVKEETEKAKEIAKQNGLDYEELERYCLCLTPILDDTPIKSIINNGYKYYNYNGNKVKSSYIQVYGMVKFERTMEWVMEIQKEIEKEELAMWVFIIFDFEKDVTHVHYIENDGSIEIRKIKKILSRGTDIMPEVESLFSTE